MRNSSTKSVKPIVLRSKSEPKRSLSKGTKSMTSRTLWTTLETSWIKSKLSTFPGTVSKWASPPWLAKCWKIWGSRYSEFWISITVGTKSTSLSAKNNKNQRKTKSKTCSTKSTQPTIVSNIWVWSKKMSTSTKGLWAMILKSSGTSTCSIDPCLKFWRDKFSKKSLKANSTQSLRLKNRLKLSLASVKMLWSSTLL